MQTFLPYASFTASAVVLDNLRLANQRNEALVILRTLRGVYRGWPHHPATRMWAGYEWALAAYGEVICDECIRRGIVDTVRPQITALKNSVLANNIGVMPPWLGRDDFHRSHQSNLIYKNPAHYRPLFIGVPDNLPYIWPRISVNVGAWTNLAY